MEIMSVSFVRESLLANGPGDETIKLWNANTGECLYALPHCQLALYNNTIKL